MRVAFDIGGTFTDVVLLGDDGELRTVKLLSLLERLGTEIAALLPEAPPRAPHGYAHATTICSNAVIEGTTAKIGLITTTGFRDVLEMRDERRPAIADVNWERVEPLVPRALRLEVEERVLGDGSVDTPVDLAAAEAAIARLRAEGVAAIAVCFVNSYLDDGHEVALGELAERLEGAPPLCLSSQAFGEVREYERTSTTCVNASLMPIVDAYLERLEGQLGITDTELLIMQSNGGLMAANVARELPVQMIESGPAAGVLAAARLAAELDLEEVISFDMGGTTAKASLIEGGAPMERHGSEVGGGASVASRLFGGAGHFVRIPSIDIVEVGAGGGSLAWIDRGGALRVGPEGAGAEPGPACYGRGGERATVTDANVVLGYMNPEAIAAGTVPIDYEAAVATIERCVAEPLGMGLLEAAHGIVRVADSAMMRALRAVTIERGRDPAAMSVVAYGGSGPLHAVRLAEALGVGEVRVPRFSGLFSAVGLLLAEYRHHVARSVMKPLAEVAEDVVAAEVAAMEEELRRRLGQEGVAASGATLSAEAELQYQFQNDALTVSLVGAPSAAEIAERFGAAHRAAYGFALEAPVLLVSLRVRVAAPAAATGVRELAAGAAAAASVHGSREAYFGARRGSLEVAVRDRAALASGSEGPLIVEEPDTSILVPPGWVAELDSLGDVVIRTPERAERR